MKKYNIYIPINNGGKYKLKANYRIDMEKLKHPELGDMK